VAGLGFAAVFSVAQTLSPGEVHISSRPYQPRSQLLRAESDVVRVDAVVRDSDGRVVPGLKAEDFAIFDNGKKQTVATFAVETRAPMGAGQAEDAALPLSATPREGASAAPHGTSSTTHARPRYVAFYFDDLNTKWGDMKHVQFAAEKFVRRGLGTNDHVALFTASSSLTVDFTPEASTVLDALAKLKSHTRVFDSGTCPRISPHDAYLIANRLDPDAYNTALAAAKECNCDDVANLEPTCYSQQEQLVLVQAKQTWEPMRELSEHTLETIRGVVTYLAKAPGDRVLVLASSGFFTGTLETQIDAVVDEALRAGIVINGLDAKGLYTEDPSGGRMSNELEAGRAALIMQSKREGEIFAPDLMSLTGAMTDFAVGTGGRFFHNRNDLSAGYSSLAAGPETEYLLGFVPEKSKSSGAFHKLKVEVNAPGKFAVQARPGYFTPTRQVSAEPTPEVKIDAEVRGSEERSDFPLSVSEKPGTASNGGREISVETRVDIQKLPFQRHKEQYVDMLTIVAALFDAQGKMVAGKEAQMELALKPESFERFSKTGIRGVMSLEAPPGAYRLRVVAQEAIHGQMSATSQNVQIQ
jgi:VWFA-related protein